MLNKIILLNSANYQKAIITLDAESIQIVGKNNIGKTTLIGVLNFLYMPNQRDWNFIHTPNETLHFYFKNLDKNYILFEIYKNSYFCILLKRDNNKIVYYKIDSPYDEIEHSFFQEKEGTHVLLDFDSIKTSLIGSIKKLDDKEYRALLYGNTKRDKSVLWLKKDIKQSTFSKIYKNLLNPSLITNEVFKESLLVADSKEDKRVAFSSDDNQKIENMQQKLKEIQRLKDMKSSFISFKETYSHFNALNKKLYSLLCNFMYSYKLEESQQLKLKTELEEEINKFSNEIINPLNEKKYDLAEKKGGLNAKINGNIELQQKTSLELSKIRSLEPIELLEISKENLESSIREIHYDLSQIQKEQYTLQSVEALIKKDELNASQLQKQIDNFENLLIHHISNSPQSSKIINSVLSDVVLKLDKSSIIKKVGDIEGKALELFDGAMDISTIDKKELINLQTLEDELKQINKNLEKLKKIKENIQNINLKEEEKRKLASELATVNHDIQSISKIPNLELELSNLQTLINEQNISMKKLLSDEEENVKSLNKATEIKEEKNTQKEITKERITTLNTLYVAVEGSISRFEIQPPSFISELTIDAIYEQTVNLKKELYEIEKTKESKFNSLKNALQKEHALEDDFIKEVEEDMDSITDKESSIDTLIDNITNETSKPTANLLTELEHFDSYVTSLNTQFKKYKISDLKSVEIKLQKNKDLLSDLSLIANIDRDNLFNSNEHNNQIEILKSYISQSKKIKLFDLFDILFVVDGKERNLKKQIESNGTDIMLKSSLFMLMISNIIIYDENNKLVLYLDELSAVDDDNVKGFIKRCTENNFIPIFASPDKKTHIQKYYDLLRLPESGKIIVDEKRALYARDRV